MKKIFLITFGLLLFPTLAFAGFKDTEHVPILEYHSVGETESRWTRSYENFKNDLLWLYNNDYYAITAYRFLHMDFDQIPSGKKPVVFTFDDGNENQFGYFEDGSIDPNSAVGMMDAFYNKHRDFGRGASFYVNSLPFGVDAHAARKLVYLLSTGREIGNHTLNHKQLSTLSAQETEFQLGVLEEKITSYVGLNFPMRTLAYPHGSVPTHLDVVKKFVDLGLLVGAEPALLPDNESFNATAVPRIQAIDYEWQRWFNRPNADMVERGKGENFMPYVHGKAEEKKAEVPGKQYPYHVCNDPNAERYILQKRVGVSFSSLRSFFLTMFGKKEEVQPRGIYLTTTSVITERGHELVEKMLESGGNAVTFDVLPAGRLIPWPGEEKINEDYIGKVKDFISYLDSKGVYKIARYVLFKNDTMAAYRPGWLLKTKSTGGIWSGDGGPVWLDPSMPEVQEYMIEASRKIAELGVDEIQYDYMRFPTAVNSKDVSYHAARTATGEMNKWMAIRDFLKNARDALLPYGVKLGADLYGIVAWNDGFDAYSTGQKIECVSPYLDVIYPMIYPSHFGPGFGGWPQPADEPYHFVKKSSELFLGYMEGTGTQLRPWLQGFAMRVSNYGSWYVPEQYRALKDLGVFQFMIWNASNIYDLHWGAFK